MIFLNGSLIKKKHMLTDDLINNYKFTKIYLIHVFNLLCSITLYKDRGTYTSAIEGLYNDFYFKELIEGKWAVNIISDKSRDLCKSFHNEYVNYLELKSYTSDLFVYYDIKWYNILQEHLSPALRSLEEDLLKNDINNDLSNGFLLERETFSNVIEVAVRPTDEDLLWKVNILYELLLDRGIIEKFKIDKIK